MRPTYWFARPFVFKIVFVELKTTGQKPKRIQVYMHKKLRALGFRVEIIDTIKGVEQFIDNVNRG